MRMEAPEYRGSYLRYYGNVWGDLPLARDHSGRLEEAIADKTKEIIEFVEELETADEVLQNPARIYDNSDVATLPLSEHPAVESFDLDPVEIGDPVVDDTKITFQNLSAEIDFFGDKTDYQDLLMEILNIKNFELADELKKVRLPEDDSEIPTLINRLQTVRAELETASEDMSELQDELDEFVLDLYGFDEETRELIKERTPTPSNPLDTRVVVTD
ncbi:hypothetical protein [Halorubrum vacuolatum]|uniref:Uncharacterized protein n=1 Tax=Halorubrum vacuolatum TaxID=63740 RepID=A0A238YD36_HALVU|nr:hypothetical protein [Halorubrum vacuolatum]SNR69125.1 hypothetical protein SAMN06264855_13912 [Halorubrum vacuolatum]